MRAPIPPELGNDRENAKCDERHDKASTPAEGAQIFEETPADPKGGAPPEADPKRGSDRVVKEEARPRHCQRPGDDAVELPQDDEKPREDDNDVAVASEESLDLAQARFGDADLAAVARQQL